MHRFIVSYTVKDCIEFSILKWVKTMFVLPLLELFLWKEVMSHIFSMSFPHFLLAFHLQNTSSTEDNITSENTGSSQFFLQTEGLSEKTFRRSTCSFHTIAERWSIHYYSNYYTASNKTNRFKVSHVGFYGILDPSIGQNKYCSMEKLPHRQKTCEKISRNT